MTNRLVFRASSFFRHLDFDICVSLPRRDWISARQLFLDLLRLAKLVLVLLCNGETFGAAIAPWLGLRRIFPF